MVWFLFLCEKFEKIKNSLYLSLQLHAWFVYSFPCLFWPNKKGENELYGSFCIMGEIWLWWLMYFYIISNSTRHEVFALSHVCRYNNGRSYVTHPDDKILKIWCWRFWRKVLSPTCLVPFHFWVHEGIRFV